MLDFKAVTLNDKGFIEELLAKSETKSSMYLFMTLYTWSSSFSIKVAREGDTLYVCQGQGEQRLYLYPAGEYKTAEAIERLKQDARERGIKLRISAEKHQLEELLAVKPNEFTVDYDRDNSEYVYSSEALISLKGRKYHGKRNHISKFIRNHPDWRFERLTEENKQLCVDISRSWCRSEHNSAECQCADGCAVKRAMEQLNKLGAVGGLIYADDKAVAFTVGERLSDDTFVVHFEKALPGYEEAYTLINQQFAEHMLRDYKYINREEDMGLEGLRRAKLSYCPEFLIDKYLITLSEEAQS